MHKIIITIPTISEVKDRISDHITQNRGRYALGLGLIVGSVYTNHAKNLIIKEELRIDDKTPFILPNNSAFQFLADGGTIHMHTNGKMDCDYIEVKPSYYEES